MTDGLNNKLLVHYSGHGLNNEPFDERTILDHSNTGPVRYSFPDCTVILHCIQISFFAYQKISFFQTFGATHPGVFDAQRRVFTLTFRGLSFEFHADTQFQVR